MGQGKKRAFAGKQHFKDRVAQQREREGEATPVGPALAPVRRNSPNLRRTEGQAARMERGTERDLHGSRAIPAHLEHIRLVAGERKRRCQTLRRSTRMNDDIGLGPRLLRSGKAAAEGPCDTLAAGIDVDQLDFGAWQSGGESGCPAADHPSADDGDPVSGTRYGIPEPVNRRFHVCGKRRTSVRDIVGNVDDGFLRNDEAVLMGMGAEYSASNGLRRALFDNADGAIAVFDGSGELACLEWAAHPLPLALRHFTAGDTALTPSADHAGRGSNP